MMFIKWALSQNPVLPQILGAVPQTPYHAREVASKPAGLD